MSIVVMVWFYVTPIIYPTDLVPERFLFYFKLNPIYGLVQGYRDILIYGQMPSVKHLLYSLGFAVVLSLVAMYVFDRGQRKFAEEI